MGLIPDEEFKNPGAINLAPMVDFLFLVLAVFATMAITRTALFDTEVNLAKLKVDQEGSAAPAFNQSYIVNISVTEDGRYKWITEVNEFLLGNAEMIQKEIYKQQELGLLPQDREQIKVLLHIDKDARWEPIAQAIFAVKEAGFNVNPVYEQLDINP